MYVKSVYASHGYSIYCFAPLEELLRAAAKQRIRRMTKAKRKRTDLQVPAYVAEQWNAGTEQREQMTDLLLELNGNKDPYPTCAV